MTKVVDMVFGSAPDAPNPQATADAQMGVNREAIRESALMNQINQVGPGYNINWSGEFGSPDRTMTYGLDPQREALAQQMGYSALNQGGYLGGDIDYSGVAGVPNYGDFGQRAGEVETTMYDALVSRMQPDLDRRWSAQEASLAERGIPLGGEAYTDTMESLARQEQDAYMGAAGQAVGLGRDESNRLFGQQMASHQAGMGDIYTDRNQKMSELAMMLNANPYNQSQIQTPTQYQMSPADMMGMTASNYNAAVGNYGSKVGGLSQIGGMVGMGAMMSDRRLKENIVPCGTLASGLPVYAFNYLGSSDRYIGVMAQDVIEVIPEAVVTDRNGYMAVNYGLLH